MNNFFYGFLYPIRSLNFFFSMPKIVLYSILPVILNLVIYSVIFYFLYGWIIESSGNVTGAFLPDATFWQEILHLIILILSFIFLLILSYLAFTIFGGLVSAPFNETISQMVEEKITNEKYITESNFMEDAWISIKAEGAKLIFYFSIIIPLFIFGFVPLIGAVVSTTLGFIFSCFYNALDFLDYPMTRRSIKLRQKIKVAQSGKMITYGFGCMAFLMMFIPVVNALLKPVLVVSGTSLFYEKEYLKKIK
jgi:CysZ protein